MGKRLSHLADEWDIPILQLIKLAGKEGVGNQPTEEEVGLLQSKLSGFYDLSDAEIRELADYLGSEDAQQILKDTVPLLYHCSDKEEECLQYIAQKLFDNMPEEFKERFQSKLKPETVRETVINLGVINVHRLEGYANENDPPPPELLKIDPRAAKKAVKRYLIRCIQGEHIQAIEDFDAVKGKLEEAYRELLENVR